MAHRAAAETANKRSAGLLSRTATRSASVGASAVSDTFPTIPADQEEVPLPEPILPQREARIEHAFNSDIRNVFGQSSEVGLMEALTRYSEAHSLPEPPILVAVREETLRLYADRPGAARMLCDPLQSAVLRMLVTITNARNVLELGAFTGYSAIALALGLDGDAARSARRVVTCEPDDTAREVAMRHIEHAGLGGHITVHSDKAADVLATLQRDPTQPLFDLAFVDADKKNYTQYVRTLIGLENGRPLLRGGALILVDNTLWKGFVLAEEVRLFFVPTTITVDFMHINCCFRCLGERAGYFTYFRRRHSQRSGAQDARPRRCDAQFQQVCRQ
jgi:predicted O-methyltransferase YrrM